jgi:hypothetical protein
MDEVSSITRGLTTDKLADVQGQAQVSVVKKAQDLEVQQAQQLIDSVPRPVSPGQPGGVINTKA